MKTFSIVLQSIVFAEKTIQADTLEDAVNEVYSDLEMNGLLTFNVDDDGQWEINSIEERGH